MKVNETIFILQPTELVSVCSIRLCNSSISRHVSTFEQSLNSHPCRPPSRRKLAVSAVIVLAAENLPKKVWLAGYQPILIKS